MCVRAGFSQIVIQVRDRSEVDGESETEVQTRGCTGMTKRSNDSL